MTPERWQRLDALYHAALARPADARAAFLADACGGDAALRGEVESLLAQSSASPFLETPAVALAADLIETHDPAPLVGQEIGTFTILALLGRGGMGEVYRARDSKLRRDVAIKVLPAALAHDPERRARFAREARLLAALHHPHIATIFGVDETSGIVALVMELVEGDTLAERVDRGALPIVEALGIARQLADALDAAHEKGIIHRDLKPANIKLTGDGTVKVLDFGLARAATADTDSAVGLSTTLRSEPGAILGTPAYMSPEQARGQAVDKRTDIWAFGCVLYEMLTGRPAFSGETISDLLANILQKEPVWDAVPAATPAGVKRLIARCLEKDQKRRARDIGDVRVELEDISSPSTGVTGAPAARSRAWIAVPWLLFVAATAGTLFAIGTRSRTASPAAMSKAEALTNDPGYTGQATLSADGRLMAYASDRSGRGDMDIWVQQTNGGSPLRITDDENDDQWPDFSPDGSQIAFRSERTGGGVYVVPSFGGAARLIAPDGRNPRFSPDGTRIAYWSGQNRGQPDGRSSETYVVSLNGGAPTRVIPDFAVASRPIWSPDGKALLIEGLKTGGVSGIFDWWWAPVDGGTPVRTGIMDWGDLRSDANSVNTVWPGPWTRSGFLIAEGAHVLMLPLSPSNGHLTGEPSALTFGVGTYGTPTISSDGQIVFSSFVQVRSIERLPLGPEAAAPVQLFLDSANAGWRASTTRDGSLIVFERVMSGRREIWMKNLGTGEQRLILPVSSASLVNPTVSADGSRLSYVIPDNGNPDFGKGFTVEMSGGVPRLVCEGCSMWGFTPDSQRAIVSDRRSIRFVSNSGSTQTIVESSSRIDRPSVSPDARSIAFRTSRGTDLKTFVAPILSSGPVPHQTWTQIDEPTTTGRACGWSPDSSTLYLLLDADGYRDLWGQKVDASSHPVGKPVVVRHLHHTTGVSTSFGNAITPQGFLYESTKVTGNLWRLAPEPQVQ